MQELNATAYGPMARVRFGDVWRLGKHRLVCGDATDPKTVAAALGRSRPHLMVTDPPYGVNYDPKWRGEVIDRASGHRKSVRAIGAIVNDDNADWRKAWALFPGDVAYVWHAALNGDLVKRGLEETGFFVRSQIIWDKGRLIISRGHYHWRHEPCWYAVRKGRTASWAGDRKQVTVWPILHRRSESGHAAQKPIDCMARPIANHTRPGDAIYDPFVGSGTTIIAAEMSGRRCCAIELNPAYVELAIARWQKHTGRRAKLIRRV